MKIITALLNSGNYSYSRLSLSYIYILILCGLLSHTLCAAPDTAPDIKNDEGYDEISHMTEVMQLIREKYVDADKVTYKNLVHNAIKGMLAGLDPFSSYMEPKFYKAMSEETNSTGFSGLGIHIAVKDNKLTIIAPVAGSPAYKAGIKPNDIIMFIDGEPTSSMSWAENMKRLQGKPGTKIKLTIYRESENLTKDITITREIITPATVKWGEIKGENIGYIRISLFAKQTSEDLDNALRALKKKKISALVLDLRGNPGGLLISAVEVCSRFIPTGELIVFVEGRRKSDRVDYNSIECTKSLNMPIAILVNGSSASAAEITSGCLQDHKRAILIGQRTFGKGSVQSIIPLPDDVSKGTAAIRLTIAKYYTPGKRVIHGHGIEPNITVDVDDETATALYSQCIAYPGEIMPKTKDAVKDVQLQRAVEILKGIRAFKSASDK